jgi:AcrR family transcriptional regulator
LKYNQGIFQEQPMNEPANSVEQKIILTTIDCIEKYGISGATNRRIAEVAGVNIAAINYYFRSKEILIQRVMEITLKNAFDMSDLPPMAGAAPKERCTAVFMAVLEGGLKYPNLTRAHFRSLLVDGQQDAALHAHLNGFLHEQAVDLLGRGIQSSEAELKPVLLQIFSVVVMAVLAPSLVEQTGVHLQDRQARRAYIERLVDQLID